jgi:hypothetical protein
LEQKKARPGQKTAALFRLEMQLFYVNDKQKTRDDYRVYGRRLPERLLGPPL